MISISRTTNPVTPVITEAFLCLFDEVSLDVIIDDCRVPFTLGILENKTFKMLLWQ